MSPESAYRLVARVAANLGTIQVLNWQGNPVSTLTVPRSNIRRGVADNPGKLNRNQGRVIYHGIGALDANSFRFMAVRGVVIQIDCHGNRPRESGALRDAMLRGLSAAGARSISTWREEYSKTPKYHRSMMSVVVPINV